MLPITRAPSSQKSYPSEQVEGVETVFSAERVGAGGQPENPSLSRLDLTVQISLIGARTPQASTHLTLNTEASNELQNDASNHQPQS